MSDEPVIGIDLGTTYSCVAIYQKGKSTIITNDQGNRLTPSIVAYTEKENLVGDSAKNQLALNPTNTIFDAKRLIGREFHDESVQDDMKNWPFQVVNERGRPKIQVTFQGEEKKLLPEEVSAMVLSKMKTTAEEFLGKPVRKAVITVPAYFTDSQRNSTKIAGQIADLDVLRIINEPTAAALAFGLNEKNSGNTESEQNVLIFDLGGGTFDVSVLSIDDGIITVKSTHGNTHLGGEDFDNRLVDYFVEEIKRMHDKDISKDKGALCRIRIQCEKAKRLLSTTMEASIEIENVLDGAIFSSSITRARFEDLNADLFRSTKEVVAKALRDAKLEKNEIHEVILVGGSTRIPKIQELLQEFFDGKELNKTINPDEAVATGAAIQAAILESNDAEVKDLLLIDVVPLSLGVVTAGGVMAVLIERNSNIPAKKTKLFTTSVDNQKTVLVQVFEGDRAMVKDNHLLGRFELKGIQPAPKSAPKIEVSFNVDNDGILNVSAVDTSTHKSESIQIVNKGRFDEDEISRMVEEAEFHRAEDAKRAKVSKIKNAIESYCAAIKSELKKKNVNVRDEGTILKTINEVLIWINVTKSDEVEEFEAKKDELVKILTPLIANSKNDSDSDSQGSDSDEDDDEEPTVNEVN